MDKSFLNRAARCFIGFIRQQFLVIFFIFALAIKLCVFINNIAGPAQSWQYWFGIICSCFSAALVFLPFIFIKKHKNLFASIWAFLLSLLLFVDTIYFCFFSAIPSVSLLSLIGEAGDTTSAIFSLIKTQYFLYFADVLLVIIFLKPLRNYFRQNQPLSKKTSLIANSIFCTAIILGFCYSILMPGINNLRDVYNQSYDSVSTSHYYGLLVTHIIDTARFINQETASVSPEEAAEIHSWAESNKPDQQTSSLNGVAAGKNIILIQVESLGSFVINQTINGEEITPTLNSLAKTTNYFPNNRFIIGAGHTSDTDFVVNSSYFPLDDASVFVRYGRDDFTGLPKLLVSNGYSAYAYHGYSRDFWSRNIALASLGYQKFYASENYSDGEEINMGLNDGDFLNETVDYIISQPKPSLSTIITLSSHIPFEITDLTKELEINPSDYPNQVGGYLEDINYVDRMLARFFERLKEEGLYDDSLIIVYGDHTPVLDSFSAGSINYDSESDQELEVPIFIKLPDQTTGQEHNDLGTSLDIMPTILDLTGINTSQLMFGQSLFAQIEDSPATCPNHVIAFTDLGDCEQAERIERNFSSKIIRYNQFQNL